MHTRRAAGRSYPGSVVVRFPILVPYWWEQYIGRYPLPERFSTYLGTVQKCMSIRSDTAVLANRPAESRCESAQNLAALLEYFGQAQPPDHTKRSVLTNLPRLLQCGPAGRSAIHPAASGQQQGFITPLFSFSAPPAHRHLPECVVLDDRSTVDERASSLAVAAALVYKTVAIEAVPPPASLPLSLFSSENTRPGEINCSTQRRHYPRGPHAHTLHTSRPLRYPRRERPKARDRK